MAHRVSIEELEVKGDNFAKVKVSPAIRMTDGKDVAWFGFYRKKYRPPEGEEPRTDAERFCKVGGTVEVELKFKNGLSDGKGGHYPDGWIIQECEQVDIFKDESDTPLTDERLVETAKEVFTKIPSRDALIVAQVAWKEACEKERCILNLIGVEEYEKMGGINATRGFAEDFFNGILDTAKGGA